MQHDVWINLISFVVAFLVSVTMSTAGVSGAFLLLPYQVSALGFAGPAVTPTNHLYNVVAIPSGVYRYVREGRMLWPLTAVIAAGTLPGVLLGSLIRIYLLPDPRSFRLFVGLVLLFIGSRLVSRLRKPVFPRERPAGPLTVEIHRFDFRRLEYGYAGERFSIPVLWLGLLTAVIGVVGGAYGVGGGAIIAPILVSTWGLPVHTIAGATLFGTFLTSTVGVVFFWVLSVLEMAGGVAPDWALGLALGLGGLIGTYTGARAQRFLPGRLIEMLLVLVVSFLGLSYVIRFFVS